MATWTVGENFSVMVDLMGTGNFVALPLETAFTVMQNNSTTTVDPLVGPVSSQISFKNWSGEIHVTRVDATYDNYRDAITNAKAAGVVMAKGAIHYSINEANGSHTDYLLSQVVFNLGKTSAAAGKVVDEVLSFSAEARAKQ